MSERIELRDPLFKLLIRFSNGELINHVAANPIDPRAITPEIRYAVIVCYSTQNPSDCTDITVVNLRDVTFIKTERVTLDQLMADRRLAGIRSSETSTDDRLPKTLAQITFV